MGSYTANSNNMYEINTKSNKHYLYYNLLQVQSWGREAHTRANRQTAEPLSALRIPE